MDLKQPVMVVDDDPAMCGFLSAFLDTRGYSSVTVTHGEEAVRRFRTERPAAVLLDIMMPGTMDGLAALAAFKQIDKDVPVIVVSGEGAATTIVKAMKLGASDFVRKPFDDAALEVPLGNALKQRTLSASLAVAHAEIRDQSPGMMLLGSSDSMIAVRDLIERVSDTDVTILILGESGTGKELVARALHDRSLRRDKPFVKVNCAALPAELLESELFGFEKGAFTGAFQDKPGKFEFANHGTMFLDEIGDMSPPLQAKLLQVLQDGEFSRLGGKNDVKVDVRVIAATNRDLEKAVVEGQFREDLYFRLNVVAIHLPPLRDRREEIPFLADHFMKKYSVQYHKPAMGVSAEMARLFMQYDWPGNVRQLENMITRMVVLGVEAPILSELRQPVGPSPFRPHAAASTPARPTSVPFPSAQTGATAIPMSAAMAAPPPTPAGHVSLKDIARTAARDAERELMLHVLTRTRWNRKEAAEILEVSYKSLLYKIKESGLDRAS